jgi:hypothetical protein
MNATADYLTSRQTARCLGTDLLTLRRRRRKGLGPVWERQGSQIRYRTTDLVLFNLAGIEI